MTEKIIITFTKLIAYYCLFYGIVKIIAIVRGAWILPNLMIIFILILLGSLGFYMIRSKQFSLGYAVIGTLSIVLLRIYESELIIRMNEVF